MNRIEIQKAVRFVLDNVDNNRRVSASAYKVKEYLVELTLNNEIAEHEFYKITSLLSPQSRSPIWEKYFIQKHKCKKVSARENKGDFEKNGLFYEYKASGYNRNNSVNIVQIRLWQQCNYIVQSISDKSIFTFKLTHQEMKKEVERLRATSAHGTKKISSENKHRELRMTLWCRSEDWSRWISRYSNREFFGSKNQERKC